MSGVLHRTDLLTIGELAARSGFAPSALRYYESLGLITSTRTSGNQRRYERAMLRRLAFIRWRRSPTHCGRCREVGRQQKPTGPASLTNGMAGSMSRSKGWSVFGTAWTAASAVAA